LNKRALLLLMRSSRSNQTAGAVQADATLFSSQTVPFIEFTLPLPLLLLLLLFY